MRKRCCGDEEEELAPFCCSSAPPAGHPFPPPSPQQRAAPSAFAGTDCSSARSPPLWHKPEYRHIVQIHSCDNVQFIARLHCVWGRLIQAFSSSLVQSDVVNLTILDNSIVVYMHILYVHKCMDNNKQEVERILTYETMNGWTDNK